VQISRNTSILIVRALAHCPLGLLLRVGALLGWLPWLASPRYRRRLHDNLAQAGYTGWRAIARAVAGIGAGALELAWVWMRPVEQVLERIAAVEGEAAIERARAQGAGIIYLTPHLGCFELAGLYLGSRAPITVMYRAPRLGWLEPLLQAGRLRGQVRTCTADRAGVRVLMRALREGEAIGVLPDQVPQAGGGEWAPFFGRPAYTSTLVTRLAGLSGVQPILVVCERLTGGRYRLRFEALELPAGQPGAAALNQAIEAAIRRCPDQYLWSYNRYKPPRAESRAPSPPHPPEPESRPS
jgi:KDO2-lipid IV(A) lauroyltransferase